ncbi:MAG: septum formation initiator family protein [Desulfobulbaceae bacterium]|uniref:Septum formation initiator family protein n=1 Tax=Candidatus Desulfatifera sulfidica TaxID=2841691 RepID=A0A8J6TDV3_9BACT|nr:septum formation initiator family protein [Candidatus Desulfatifera sulfidica]
MKRKPQMQLSPMQQKAFCRLAVLFALLLVLWLVFAPGKGILFLKKQQSQITALEAETRELEADNERLRQEINRVQTDAVYLEQVARGQHGLLKENEMVFEFPDGK